MDKLTLHLLELFSERKTLSLRDLAVLTDCGLDVFATPVYWLFKNKYLEISDFRHQDDEMYTVSTQLRITQDGRNYLSEHHKKANIHKINEIRAWLTLAIALAAFIKSFFF